jgi:branched-chain amino acid transport system substrate-binding protein
MTPRTDTAARAHELVAAHRPPAEAKTLRIGIITPLSPPGDPTAGELVVRGACLGARYVREHGGSRDGALVDLRLRDDQETADVEPMGVSAVGAMAKLTLVDDVLAACGQWHLRTTPSVVEVADRFGVPIFVENGHNTVTREGRRTVFRTYYTIDERSRLMVGFMREQGVRRIGLIAADTVFGLSTAQTLTDLAREAGIEVIRFDFEQESTTDFRPQLRKFDEAAVDLIVNAAVIRTNYLVIAQAAELGLRPRVPMMAAFSYPLRSDDFWRLAGAAGEGMLWPATQYRPSWPGLTERGRWFTQAYAETFGSTAPDTALSAFTDVTIIADAHRLARGDTRADLVDALEEHTFETWRGPVSFNRGDDHWHHDAATIWIMQYQRLNQNFDEAAVVFPADLRSAAYVPPASDR